MNLLLQIAIVTSLLPIAPQDRLREMPGYSTYSANVGKINNSVIRGDIRVNWIQGQNAFTYNENGKTWKYEIAKKVKTEFNDNAPANVQPRDPRRQPSRGRQFTQAFSPDGKWEAAYDSGNVKIRQRPDGEWSFITREGDLSKRLAFGTASWVYGEELGVREAMWWSPDSTKLAYYGVDNTHVKDYFVTLRNTAIQNTLLIEPYPKAGDPNPILDLYIFDQNTQKTIKVDSRNNQPLDNDSIGHYIYSVRWSPDGKELYFNRTNRKQNIMEWVAANPTTGHVRTIIREENKNGWVMNSPPITWIDQEKLVWLSERNGFRNYYLYDTQGKLITPLTQHEFEVAGIVRVTDKYLFYLARSGDNPYKIQLHRVGLDGKNDMRITNPAFHHTISLSHSAEYFVDIEETHQIPPTTAIRDADGKLIDTLKTSDITQFEKNNFQKAEVFTYTAADGITQCYGMLQKPSNFDQNKKYPLLVSVYAGPESGGISERFALPSQTAEFGFIIATLHGRGTSGRGRTFLDAVYQKLGIVEIDDQAAGVKELIKRNYINENKIGIYGTSYGGYAAIMSILRYPELFHAACASASVTDWRNYDTIYTERYMWIPQENKKGYDEGSAMAYAQKLKGRLMLFHGTADDNVHFSNTLQLINALQAARKSFEVQIGPDRGHASIDYERMMEFFIENLVMK